LFTFCLSLLLSRRAGSCVVVVLCDRPDHRHRHKSTQKINIEFYQC
jgi:hypothetical protein